MFTEAGTTDISRLLDHQFAKEDIRLLGLDVAGGIQTLLCLAVTLGLAVKLPIWPLHAWHPDAQLRAPLAAAIVLSALLTLLAGYGLLRIALPIFPTGALQLSPLIFALASATALFAAVSALSQSDFRKMVAYISMTLIALAAMGLFSLNRQGFDGAIILMLSQGLVAGGLLLSAGVLLDRQNSTRLDSFGGLSIKMPVFAGLMLFMIWTALGLPGSAGFVALVLTLSGLAAASPWVVIVAFVSLGLIAGALLSAFRKIMRGDLIKESLKSVEDLKPRERLTLMSVAAVTLVLGLYPAFVTDRTGAATQSLAELFEQERQAGLETSKSFAGFTHPAQTASLRPLRDIDLQVSR